MTIELTNDLLKSLLKMIANAQKEAVMAQRLVASMPSLPQGAYEAARLAVNEEYAPVMRSIEDRPSDAVLELLRHCGETIQ